MSNLLWSRAWSRFALIVLASALVLPLSAQVLVRGGPVGSMRQAGPIARYEVNFSEPVLVTAPHFDVVSFPPLTFPRTMESPMGTSANLGTTAHRALVPAGMTIGGPHNDWTIEFLIRSDLTGSGSAGARCVLSYATPFASNELLVNIGGQLWFGNSVVRTDPDAVAGEWRQVSIKGIADASSTEIYVYYDGASLNSVTVAGHLSPGGYLVLGEDQDAVGAVFDPNQAFLGDIDELRVWNVARTSADIAQHSYRPIDPSTPGLVHYWNFDEVSDLGLEGAGANDVADLAGNSNMSLENGLDATEVITPARFFPIEADISGLGSDFRIQVSLAGALRDTAGVAQSLDPRSFFTEMIPVPNPPQLLPSTAQGLPTLGAFVERELRFDQLVEGVELTDFALSSATLPGTTLSAVATGYGNAAEIFDPAAAGGAYLRDDDFQLPPGDFTVECWYLPSRTTSAIFSFASDTPNAFLFFANGEVIVDNTLIFPAIDVGQLDGRWHHIRVTVEANRMTRYFDGVLAGEAVGQTMNSNRSGYLVIGNDQDGFGSGLSGFQALDGSIDELRIHETASPAVAWNAIADIATPDLWSYYRFESLQDLGVLGSSFLDFEDLVGGRHLDAVQGITADGPDRADTWRLRVDFPSPRTNYLDVDLVGTIADEFGRTLTSVVGSTILRNVHVEDLTMSVAVAGDEPQFGRIGSQTGDALLFNLRSPEGTFTGTGIPLIFAQFPATGTDPASVFGFPELRLDLGQPIFTVFDGAVGGFFGPSLLPPVGHFVATSNPGGLSGTSVVVQGLVLDGPSTVNGIFAAANVVVVDL